MVAERDARRNHCVIVAPSLNIFASPRPFTVTAFRRSQTGDPRSAGRSDLARIAAILFRIRYNLRYGKSRCLTDHPGAC
jgi:hypothetical protein